MSSKTSPRATGKSGKSSGKGGGRPGRKPVKPIKPSLPWGMIALASAVAIVAVGIIGYGAYSVRDAGKPFGERKAQQIDGVQNFRKTNEKDLTRNHKAGNLTYKQTPPVGGDHNGRWQNCEGDVYAAEIPKEQAVHSMEHGAVWLAYNPDLPKSDVDALAKKIRGKDFTLMSPFPGLDKAVSLQAWGFQLKVDKADDERIDKFIDGFARGATVEPQAGCSGGVTSTGTDPAPAEGAQQPGQLPGQPPGQLPGQPQPPAGG
jgi:hypothetical protein